MVLSMDNKALVVQSNRLIEAKYRLSIEEQKIVKILISRIQKDDKDFQDYEFHVKDLAELLGMNYDNPYVVLRRITKNLITKPLEFENPEKNELLQAAWLSSARYRTGAGIVSLRFDPLLKPLLLELKSYFTKYELEKILQFRGQYSIRFFEFRKSFIGRNKHEVIFTLKKLWEILGLKKDEYKIFRDFKNRALEPARLELLEKTGKSFTWEPIKQGRGGKIISVRFIFDADTDTTNEVTQAVPQPTVATPQVHGLPDEVHGILKELLALGITNKVAQEMVNQHTDDHLRVAIALTNQQTDLKNPAGFLIEALNGEWRNSKQEQVKKQQHERQVKDDVEARKKNVQQLKRRFTDFRRAAAECAYQEIPEPLIQQWQDEFMQTQPAILRRNKVIGFENPRFRAFVMQKLSLPKLEDFLEQEGVQLQEEERTWWNQL
ncbi:hypothetical protein BN874_840009 [Candidatus Contendobacter odensis Run_B_J11]|uniref:Initiator Rep protein WH1 domain-containing protein n=2 Tax=Candidatus Contendibacter odensensis TaxID=1400860 RepID=A0A7U7J622_9GAMM|nr:hypothetical protein BN874_840009 [Candidatus Contendobacter odensis Run_B_J11]